jgi:hypothetical protein
MPHNVKTRATIHNLQYLIFFSPIFCVLTSCCQLLSHLPTNSTAISCLSTFISLYLVYSSPFYYLLPTLLLPHTYNDPSLRPSQQLASEDLEEVLSSYLAKISLLLYYIYIIYPPEYGFAYVTTVAGRDLSNGKWITMGWLEGL